MFAQGDFANAADELATDPHSPLALQQLAIAQEKLGNASAAESIRTRLKYQRAPTVEWYLTITHQHQSQPKPSNQHNRCGCGDCFSRAQTLRDLCAPASAPSALKLLPSAFCLLPFAFCLLPFALLPFAFRLKLRLPERHPQPARQNLIIPLKPH